MKRITLLFFLYTSALYGQYLGSKDFSLPSFPNMSIGDISVQNDSICMITGSGYYPDYDSSRAFLIKTDAALNVLWAKSYRLSRNTFFTTVTATSDGNYLVGGTIAGLPVYGIVLSKIDAEGNVIWVKFFDYSGEVLGGDILKGIYELSDGSFMVFALGEYSVSYPYIIHLDSAGNIITEQMLVLENLGTLFHTEVCRDGSDGFYMMGFNSNSSENNIVYLAKVIPDGMEWVKYFEFNRFVYPEAVVFLPDGHLLISGSVHGDSADSYRPFLLKIDSDGNAVWAHKYNAIGLQSAGIFASISALPNSHFVADGSIQSNDGSSGLRLLEFNSEGEILWTRSLEGSVTHNYDSMPILSDGRILFNFWGPTGQQRVTIVNSEGHNACATALHNMIPTDVDFTSPVSEYQYMDYSHPVSEPHFQIFELPTLVEEICATPDGLPDPHLLSGIQVFPNPSTGLIHIRVDQAPANTSLRVIDTQGTMVKELKRINQNAFLDLSDQPPGLYLLQFLSEKGVVLKRVILE